jgi:hypothetical protein
MTFNAPESGPRSLQASLRVPAGVGDGARWAAQAGTRRGADAERRGGDAAACGPGGSANELARGRAAAAALLAERTGKIEDVLQVEEEIARVRGEIEAMEAEQKAQKHRVDFASVDLRLVEEYTAQLGTPAEGVGPRLHNSLVAGVRNAGASLLGLLLFEEEYGPVMLIWGVILGAPAWLVWRRYRRCGRVWDSCGRYFRFAGLLRTGKEPCHTP